MLFLGLLLAYSFQPLLAVVLPAPSPWLSSYRKSPTQISSLAPRGQCCEVFRKLGLLLQTACSQGPMLAPCLLSQPSQHSRPHALSPRSLIINHCNHSHPERDTIQTPTSRCPSQRQGWSTMRPFLLLPLTFYNKEAEDQAGSGS